MSTKTAEPTTTAPEEAVGAQAHPRREPSMHGDPPTSTQSESRPRPANRDALEIGALYDDYEEAPSRWENPIPFNDAIRKGTRCIKRFIVRWDGLMGKSRKRAFVAWYWRQLSGRRVQVEMRDEYLSGDIVGFDLTELDILALGDVTATGIEWKDLLSIGEFVPVTDSDEGRTTNGAIDGRKHEAVRRINAKLATFPPATLQAIVRAVEQPFEFEGLPRPQDMTEDE